MAEISNNGEPEIPPGGPVEVPPEPLPADIPPGGPPEIPVVPPETPPGRLPEIPPAPDD